MELAYIMGPCYYLVSFHFFTSGSVRDQNQTFFVNFNDTHGWFNRHFMNFYDHQWHLFDAIRVKVLNVYDIMHFQYFLTFRLINKQNNSHACKTFKGWLTYTYLQSSRIVSCYKLLIKNIKCHVTCKRITSFFCNSVLCLVIY